MIFNQDIREIVVSIYLLHVQFHHIGQICAWFEVAKEGSLQSPLVQEVHGMSLELSILVWHTNKHSNTPALDQ